MCFMDGAWMKRACMLALGAASTWVLAAQPVPQNISAPGQWSSQAVYLWPGPTALADAPDGPRLATIPAPDGKRVLHVDEYRLSIDYPRGKGTMGAIDIDALTEVAWSPDSRRFEITSSDGGWVGSWTAVVYTLDQRGITPFEVSPLVTARFQARRGACDEQPNVAAVGWINADVLLVVAEAPPHSSCKDMGVIRGYEVSLRDGTIRSEYSSSELSRRFGGMFGARFKAR